MAGGLFSRIKTWIKDEVIKASDLNAEFNNIITNLQPTKIDDYSAEENYIIEEAPVIM